MPDYTGDLNHCAAIADQPGLLEAREQTRARALAYLRRMTGDTASPIGARKRKRLKSMHWGLALDNALMYATSRGLDFYEITDDLRRTTPPHKWPSLTIVPDQGSDGFCFINFLSYGINGKKYNVRVSWDKSHGAHNDVKLSVKAAGLWGHALLSSVAAAAPYSPWGTSMRKVQVQEAMEEFFECHDWQEPMYQSVLPHILE